MTAAFKIDGAITKVCFAFDEWDTQEQEESGTDYSFSLPWQSSPTDEASVLYNIHAYTYTDGTYLTYFESSHHN